MGDILEFFEQMGFLNMTLQQGIMLLLSFFLLFLAIKKQYEPLLLLPIAFGMLLTNLPGAGMYHSELWAAFLDANSPAYHSYGTIMREGGLLDILYKDEAGIYTGFYTYIKNVQQTTLTPDSTIAVISGAVSVKECCPEF